MQDKETVDARYQQGFNEGYIVTKYLPTLSESLAKVKSEALRIVGFRDGRKQCVLEQTKEQHLMPHKEKLLMKFLSRNPRLHSLRRMQSSSMFLSHVQEMERISIPMTRKHYFIMRRI